MWIPERKLLVKKTEEIRFYGGMNRIGQIIVERLPLFKIGAIKKLKHARIDS